MKPAATDSPKEPLSAEDNARLDHAADQDFEQGRGVALKEAAAWVRFWFSPRELPRPKSRKI